ncbi:MAG TPA: NAD(P)-binding domain-containing protein, partial [Trinickia sp.]|nr:NAD(P)-binding domain-containing protein [Trinickia sp.]
MPLSSVPRLGFIGAGRLARCLALAFARAGYPVVAVASRSAHSARELAAKIDGCCAVGDSQQVVADS